MNLQDEIKGILHQGHILSFEPVSDFRKEENKKNVVKDIYKIKIHHEDNQAGFFFSKFASEYHKKISSILEKRYQNRIYITCTSECGPDLHFDVVFYNRDKDENK